MVKVMPREYKRALAEQAKRREQPEPLVEQLVVTQVVTTVSGAGTAVHG